MSYEPPQYKIFLSKSQVKNIKSRVSAEEGKRLDEMIEKGEIKILGGMEAI